MGYLYETHLHTDESSRCGKMPARETVHRYQDKGYAGIVITDHFYASSSYVPDRALPWSEQIDLYCRGYEEAYDEGLKCGMNVFFGVETEFNDDEALLYGVDKAWLKAHPDIYIWDRRKLLDEVHAAGGAVVQAHPFRIRGYVKYVTLNTCVDAIEVYNVNNRDFEDTYARLLAEYLRLPMTAGSDNHNMDTQRTLYAVQFDKPWKDISDYVSALRGKLPFETVVEEGRGQVPLQPLERFYEMRDGNDRRIPFDVQTLIDMDTARRHG